MSSDAAAYRPIVATTCEAKSSGQRTSVIAPSGLESPELFPFQDPFDLRRAVLPVLMNDNEGVTKGIGTAFHVDGWGTLITAEHVVQSVRKCAKRELVQGDEIRFRFSATDVHPLVILGMGLVIGGPVDVPREALALVSSIYSPIREREDPLGSLIRRTELEAALDVAVMQLAAPVPPSMMGTLPVRFRGWRPRFGDTVVALGFPELECEPVDEQGIRYLLSDGMSAAYGRVVAAHPDGLRGSPTPVIEVEANWPGGMSGGPVINETGEVVGIVSRSLTGIGSAACFELIPWLRKWMTTIDTSNPGWRVGWGLVKNGTSELAGFYKEKNEALLNRQRVGSDFSVAFGSNRIGSTDFVSHSET